ncbi:hydrolase 76 protein [Chytriomyces hyalinus]|nr:hydrolase 76 protein [Chytriomyces hyalinus]
MKVASIVATATLACQLVLAQQSFDLKSKDATLAAAKKAMQWMPYYFSGASGTGYWDESIVHWHESGQYFGLFYDYRAVSGDSTYDAWVEERMILNTVGGDFMDGNNPILARSGRWNDDIAWWALGTMTAAEVWGPQGIVMPSVPENGGAKYLSIVQMTWDEMMEDWDTTTCKGGLYWSRDRNSAKVNQRYYKSTIANAQHVQMSARLYAMTGEAKYLQTADMVYSWLKSSGLITADFSMYDGYLADDPNSCGVEKRDSNEWSYQLGEIISALSFLYKKTQDPKYITDAHVAFAKVQSHFVQNGVIADPVCTASAGACKSPAAYSWALIQSLPDLHAVTPDAEVKSSIETILRTSAAANFQGCNQDWNCIRTLNPVPEKYTFPNGTNPRDQFETMFFLNALARINGDSKIITQTQKIGTGGDSTASTAGPQKSESSSQSPGANKLLIPISIGVGALAVACLVVFCCIQSRKKKNNSLKEQVSQEIYYESQNATPAPRGPVQSPGGKRGYAMDEMYESRARHRDVVAGHRSPSVSSDRGRNGPPASPYGNGSQYAQQQQRGYPQQQQVYGSQGGYPQQQQQQYGNYPQNAYQQQSYGQNYQHQERGVRNERY